MVALEMIAVALGGSALGAAPGWLTGQTWLAVVGGAVAGLNGAVCGARQVYDWSTRRGWAAFVLDSTWGLVGSSLGVVVHALNLVWTGSDYRADLSRRRSRHVYEHGFRLKSGYAVTMGNAISNAAGKLARLEDSASRALLIEVHEELHVWQNRLFGPLMQVTYALWAAGGLVYGMAYWLGHRDQSLGSIIETTVYYDNPFEYWAYRKQRYWPPSGSHPGVRWRGTVT